MIPFEQIWPLLYEHGASEKKEEGTRRFWANLTPYQQEKAFTTINTKLQEGKFVQYDPIRAIKENIPHHSGIEKLSFNDYYQRFGTTEEVDGWRRQFIPEQQKTIYVKAG